MQTATAALGWLAVVLAVILFLDPSIANAQARGPGQEQRSRVRQPELSSETRAVKLAELEAWLGRLAGRFQVEGSAQLDAGYLCGGCRETGGMILDRNRYFYVQSTRGVANCARVGSGAGIHCVINVPLKTTYFTATPMGTIERNWPEPGTLAPMMMLMGIDPGNLEISYLQVDDKSLAWWARSAMKDDRVAFKTRCVNNSNGSRCERSFSIRASRDGKHVELTLDIQMFGLKWAGYRFIMNRVSDARATDKSDATVLK